MEEVNQETKENIVNKEPDTVNDKKSGESKVNGYALISLVLGGISLIVWKSPLLGYISTIIAIVLGCISKKSRKSTMSLIGIVLGSVGLALTVCNSVLGVFFVFMKNI